MKKLLITIFAFALFAIAANGQSIIQIPGNIGINGFTNISFVNGSGGYDANSNTILTVNVAAEQYHRTSIEHIIDITNDDTDSISVFEMDTYENFSIHYKLDAVSTLKIYVSNNSAASNTSYASDWVDYTTEVTGAATKTNVEEFKVLNNVSGLKFMFVITKTNSTNTSDVWTKRWN
jgi:hypothetical protein